MFGLLTLLALAPLTLAGPVDVSARSPSILQKRAPVCDARLGGLASTADCEAALARMPQTTALIARAFTTNPSPNRPDDITLPLTYSVGECTIGLNIPGPERREAAVWPRIRAATKAIIDTCVTPTRQGGRNTIGARGRIEITIYQYSEEEDDDGPTITIPEQCKDNIATCFEIPPIGDPLPAFPPIDFGPISPFP
ncbi:MAG: hypothetical protein M1817_002264 [Caeruleum heppii]|nr:MAG: hypothetical protein M1817_002264 [Caeruleum heppii]